MIIVDEILYAMVEQDPDKSLNNFIRYNVPKLLRLLQENPESTDMHYWRYLI